MKEIIKCEICRNSDWKLIETFKYSKNKIRSSGFYNFKFILKYINLINRVFLTAKPRSYEVSAVHRNEYQLSRIKVLFNVWFKNSDQVIIKSQYCRNCGFALFIPRPSKKDIEDKYKYLIKKNISNKKINDIKNKNIKITKLDFERSRRIFYKCMPYCNKKYLEVLDYGGGKGTNLINFLKNGNKCYLIDFNKENLKGIKNIGSSINDIDNNQKFDLIICSHVLEHISDLKNIINKLKNNLKDKGIIYAEVPLEIKAGISLEYDPVTHINFFTSNSLANLFLKNGFKILDSSDEVLPYSFSFLHASWIIVQNTKHDSFPLIKSDIINNLFPSRINNFFIFLRIFSSRAIWEIKKRFINKIYR